MPTPKLDRAAEHDMNVNDRDRLELWQNNLNFNDWNLTIKTHNGGQLRLFKVSEEQLADLAVRIVRALSDPSPIARQHLRQCHELLGLVLDDPPTDRDFTG